jgi:hypothetical protein
MADEVKSHWQDQVSIQVLEDTQRWARITGLPMSRKLQAWDEIKLNSPALVYLLKDPLLHEAVLIFDADIFVEHEIVPSLPTEHLKTRLPD